MAPVLAMPGVHVEPRSGRWAPMRLARGGLTAFVGRVPCIPEQVNGHSRPPGRPVSVDSPSRYTALFGFRPVDPLGDAVRAFFGHGGRICRVVPTGQLGLDPAPGPDAVTGGSEAAAVDAGPDARVGVRALEDDPDTELICLPDLWTDLDGAPEDDAGSEERVVATLQAVAALAWSEGTWLVLADAPPGADAARARAFRRRLGDSPRTALFHPWLKKVRDGGSSLVAPSGVVAGLCARLAADGKVHNAPANIPVDVTDLARPVRAAEVARLNGVGVNCFRVLPGRGVRLWGARTLASDSGDDAARYINVQRILGLLRRTLQQQTAWAVFEPNDRGLWKQIQRDVHVLLESMWRDGMLLGAQPSEAFFVVCDERNNPAASVAAGSLVIDVGLAPVRPAEFITVRVLHDVPEEQVDPTRVQPEDHVSERAGPGAEGEQTDGA